MDRSSGAAPGWRELPAGRDGLLALGLALECVDGNSSFGIEKGESWSFRAEARSEPLHSRW
jgi:hypothetical protein